MKNISDKDWQYLIPVLVCTICFIATDIVVVVKKIEFSYWSGLLSSQPYRIITNHFIHQNTHHLLANISGIVVARYCLNGLSLKGKYFFLILIMILVPLQTLLFWFSDLFIFNNTMSIAIGFSGIIYGVDSFILLSSIYGKNKFLWLQPQLRTNKQIRKILVSLTVIGCLWSLLPGISLLGHLTGMMAGVILFLLF